MGPSCHRIEHRPNYNCRRNRKVLKGGLVCTYRTVFTVTYQAATSYLKLTNQRLRTRPLTTLQSLTVESEAKGGSKVTSQLNIY